MSVALALLLIVAPAAAAASAPTTAILIVAMPLLALLVLVPMAMLPVRAGGWQWLPRPAPFQNVFDDLASAARSGAVFGRLFVVRRGVAALWRVYASLF